MAASSRGGSGARRAFVAVALVALVLFAALSAAWYYLARELDTRSAALIERAAAGGTAIDCAGREVFGYPFRLGLSCEAIGVEAPAQEFRATAGALRTASQIYDPARIVAEIAAPMFLDARGMPPMDLRWQLAQASLRLGLDGARRLSAVVIAPDAALAEPAGGRRPIATADRFEFHLRRNEADLDVASSDRALRLAGAPDLAPMDMSLDLTVTGAGDWMTGALPRGSARDVLAGREGVLRSAKIELGAPNLELSGPWRFSADGVLSAEFQLAIAEPREVARAVAALVPGFSPFADQAASAVGFLGRRENGRSILPLTVRDGAVTLGILPLGRVPPLR